MTGERDPSARRWIDEAEEALNRVGNALSAGWEESHEARMATLQSAREATSRLGDAIDQGMAAAREKWDPAEGAPPAAEGADEEE